MLRQFSIGRLPPFGDLKWDVPPSASEAKQLAEVHLLVGPNGTGKSLMLATLAACLGAPKTLQTRIEGSSTSAQLQWIGPTGRSPILRVSKNNATRPPPELAELPAVAFGGTAFLMSPSDIPHGQPIELDRQGALAFRKPHALSAFILNAIHRLKVEAALRRGSVPVDQAQPVTAGLLIDRIERAIQSICGFGNAPDFHFHVTTYPADEVRVHWEGRNLPINALADGLRSLVGWLTSTLILLDQQARQAGHADVSECQSVILLDEIEAHLHPAWQRRVIPTFQRLLPKAQIFCATHSPFVISSLNHGWIHRFEKDASGKVSIAPVPASPGDSYDSVIEDIMGIKERFDPETEDLLAEFRAQRETLLKTTEKDRKPLLVTVRTMADRIGARGLELQYMMGRELQQLDRLLEAGGGR